MDQDREVQHMIGMDITPMGMTRRVLFDALGVIESPLEQALGAPVITSLGEADMEGGPVPIRCGYFFDGQDKLCRVVVKTHGELPSGAGLELYHLFQDHMEDNYGESPYRDQATAEGETGLESVWLNQGSPGNKLDVKLAWAAQQDQEFVVVIHKPSEPSGTSESTGLGAALWSAEYEPPAENMFDRMRKIGKGRE